MMTIHRGLYRMSRTHEEIVGVGNIAADAEKLHQVVELAVDIAAYLYICQ